MEIAYWKKTTYLEEKFKSLKGDMVVVQSTNQPVDNFIFSVITS